MPGFVFKTDYNLTPPRSTTSGPSPSSAYAYVDSAHPDTLVCVICHCPFVDPVAPCQEGHVFCRFCLTAWVENPKFAGKCPGPGCKEVLSLDKVSSEKTVKPVEKMADALKVTCPNKAKGCSWADERNSLKRHLDDQCAFFPCPKEGCTHVCKQKDLQRHVCPFESVQCPQGCGLWGLRRGLEEHVKTACKVTKANEEARLDREKRAARDAKAKKVQALVDETGKWVEMDVRGVSLRTTLATLQKFPESTLALYVGQIPAGATVVRINRDPAVFQPLVHWLATGEERGCPQVLLELEKKFWDIPFRLSSIRSWANQPLAGVDLAGMDLKGLNLRDVDLRDARLTNADLSGACIDGADLSGADLVGAKLPATFSKETNFDRANLSGQNLSFSSSFSNGSFNQANLSNARLPSGGPLPSSIVGANLTGVDLSSKELQGAHPAWHGPPPPRHDQDQPLRR